MDKEEQIYQNKDAINDHEASLRSSMGSSLSSSTDVNSMEDETSSSCPSQGPLYELSELMAQLPIKRSLSKFYQGKSQTFTSLSSVKSLEDLAKRGRPSRRKIKSCNDIYRPTAIISKKKSSSISLISNPKIRWSGSTFRSFDIL